MIVLNSTRKLQVVLAAVVAANQLDFLSSYVDVGSPDVYEPESSHGVTADAVDVDVTPAPIGASTKRQQKFLSVYNRDTAAADVTVKLDEAGVERILCRVTLAAKSTLVYTDGEGFRVILTTGAIL